MSRFLIFHGLYVPRGVASQLLSNFNAVDLQLKRDLLEKKDCASKFCPIFETDLDFPDPEFLVMDLVFFHESVSPKPLSIPLGPFQTCSKIAEIQYLQLKVHHRRQMKKIYNKKSFKYFFFTPLGSRVNICRYTFFLDVSSLI
jgi:hypothetical protein